MKNGVSNGGVLWGLRRRRNLSSGLLVLSVAEIAEAKLDVARSEAAEAVRLRSVSKNGLPLTHPLTHPQGRCMGTSTVFHNKKTRVEHYWPPRFFPRFFI